MPLLQDRRYNIITFMPLLQDRRYNIITFMPLLQDRRYNTYNVYASVTRQTLQYV